MSFGTKGCMYCEGECNKECLSQEKPKQETVEEAAWRYNPVKKLDGEFIRQAFKEGASWQAERMYSEEDMIAFAEFVATYPNKNRNIHHEILHAKSKYDEAERTIDLLTEWFKKK